MACADCFSGTVQEGVPRGKIAQIHGLEAYVSEPPAGRQIKGVLVIITDVFGIHFVNTQLLADRYSEKGDYKVYVPDFTAGRPCPIWVLDSIRVVLGPGNYLGKAYHTGWLLLSLASFFAANRLSASYPRVRGFFTSLRGSDIDLPIFAAGFCWGGKHLVLLAGESSTANGIGLIDAGFTGHPSWVTVPGDIERMKKPISFALGIHDGVVPMDQVEQIKAIVEAKPELQRGEVRVYPDCGHGFCVRADTQFPDVAKQAALAEDQCINWFKQFERE